MELLTALFWLEGPPDTSGYMILGYSVIFGVLLLHLLSLSLRRRNLQQDLELLEELKGRKAKRKK